MRNNNDTIRRSSYSRKKKTPNKLLGGARKHNIQITNSQTYNAYMEGIWFCFCYLRKNVFCFHFGRMPPTTYMGQLVALFFVLLRD